MQVPPTNHSPRAPLSLPVTGRANFGEDPRSPKQGPGHSTAVFKAAGTCTPRPPATGHWASSSECQEETRRASSNLTACTLPRLSKGQCGVKVTGQTL